MLCSLLLFASLYGWGLKIPELAIEIPKDAKVYTRGGWAHAPLRPLRTFRYGYFLWCDDPSCPQCGEFVYRQDWGPRAEIRR